jgi:hypothetical protein
MLENQKFIPTGWIATLSPLESTHPMKAFGCVTEDRGKHTLYLVNPCDTPVEVNLGGPSSLPFREMGYCRE